MSRYLILIVCAIFSFSFSVGILLDNQIKKIETKTKTNDLTRFNGSVADVLNKQPNGLLIQVNNSEDEIHHNQHQHHNNTPHQHNISLSHHHNNNQTGEHFLRHIPHEHINSTVLESTSSICAGYWKESAEDLPVNEIGI